MTTLEEIRSACTNTMVDALGIEIIEANKERVVGTMPVDERTRQRSGILHGGASVAFAETLASIGSWIQVMEQGKIAVGQEINANHLRSVREGIVRGVAEPIHVGSQTQVWEIRISDEQSRLTCISRCTLFNISKS